ncbi:putative hydroxymethylglutaryl-CoA synthase [Tricharina praecox]|uniref:putative hydroxymethylglutaryl-CoA synthase n=1 Tax=Tricharina praecox TaxID=43433 RepID=UPI00221E3D64|nr:putative hydroxymethylglutaryl-CoA synthase [Tricharina praecox]KAI5858569.1 putative hydroxymethylglutaryl-CoA synthase [Tricharina praecox]
MSARPENIGIKAIEIYFPNQCVEQSELEKFDGVSTGKYTIGLGQTKMAFCDDREDIYSMALTVTQSLIEKYSIDTDSIGRLEVGTETILDKSKSVKSVLMKLFGKNTNVEGVDTLNACYGGTNALFNAINWVESSAWDGRDAIVVAGDIALYAKGAARPTGGAGAVAMLIGPDAPLVFEPGKRGSYMAHAYDFYKPDLTSEYPVVDGHFSIRCYTEAVDACYKAYNKRVATLAANRTANGSNGVNGAPAEGLDRFDYLLFHAPTCKLVAKSYARMLYNDYVASPTSEQFGSVPEEMRDIDYETSLADRNIEKTFVGLSKKRFAERVQPSIEVPTNCGNMYTASVYSGLCALLKNVDSETLQGKRVGLFSYGSGLASSLFSMTVKGSTKDFQDKLNLTERLAARNIVAPEVYDSMCELRHNAHGKKSYTPSGSVDTITKGTFYLVSIDDKFRREYVRKD